MKRDLETSLSDVTRILSEPSLTEADLTRLEDELKKTNEEVSRLSEQKQSKASSGDSKITLFRQQATIIARKKEGTATQLADLQETVAKLTTEVQEKVTLAQSSTASKVCL